MRVTIHQPEHLPWLGFFAKAASSDLFILLDTVAYRHGYFQNRNRLSQQGQLVWLTVPVQHRGHFGEPIRDIRIDHRHSWRRRYLGRLEDSFRRAPQGNAVTEPIRELVCADTTHLLDLNMQIIEWLCKLFGIRTQIILASQLTSTGRKSELLAALAAEVGANVYLSGPSGEGYLDLDPFRERSVAVEYFEFNHPRYPRDPEPWISHLSAVDLVANLGQEDAARTLRGATSASQLRPATG